MTESPNGPDLTKRRTRVVTPAPDEGRHPIEGAKPEQSAAVEDDAPTRKLDRINIQVSPEVAETIELAKYKTKRSKRALVEEAVLHYWSQYSPTQK